HLALAAELDASGDAAGATSEYEAAIHLQPMQAELRLAYADLLAKTKRNEDAALQYRTAARLQPKGVELRLAVVEFPPRGGQGAAQEVAQSLRETRGHARAVHLLGTLFEDAGRRADAIEEYREAVRLDPTLGEAWFDLAGALEKNDQPMSAATAYRRYLAVAEKDPAEAKRIPIARERLRGLER